MSYQVLARKWRPKSFQQLMGQEHVVTVLTNALTQQRLHHAYLFTGTRGVGKTTIARIFAKSLNCETGVTATPCGQCDICQDIDLGRFVDLLEIDAASRTKVDDTREILDNVQYAPSRGRYKVYLIDEVHMLSRSSFNALLKTLEEPPEHVKFILATTDPQKLPVTVLSRCLQFHLKALSVKQIEQQLQIILNEEQVTIESSALTLLAKAARGSMRDSLSLTDQAIAQGQGVITAANVQQMLGGVDNNWVFKILVSLLKQDGKAMMELSLDIASYAPNYRRLMADLIQLLHQIAMAQVVETSFDLSAEHQSLFTKFCQAMSPENVQLYYQIVVNGRKDLAYAADEQAAFDMTLLRMLAFQPQQRPTQSLPEQVKVADDFDDVTLLDKNLSTEQHQPPNVDTGASQEESINPDSISNTDNTSTDIIASEKPSPREQTSSRSSPELTDQKLTDDLSVHVDDANNDNSQDLAQQLSAQMLEIEQTAVQQRPTELTANQHAAAKPEVDLSRVDRQTPSAGHQIETVIANRNMLRSRKKALEDDGKKSSDAPLRQPQVPQVIASSSEPANEIPAIESITTQSFSVDNIDPAEIKLANQVDKWANMIDNMALQGRLRQLAIHATIGEESTENLLILKLDQATKHLKTDTAHRQLEQHLSKFLGKAITVELELVALSKDDPFQIQNHIDDKRYDYAKALIEKDQWVIAMKNQFQASVDEKTIQAR